MVLHFVTNWGMSRYFQRRIYRAAENRGCAGLHHGAIPARSCAPSTPSTGCRIEKAGICSPVLCWKHMQPQLLITSSRLLVVIKWQSFTCIPWAPKGSGLSRRPTATQLFPGRCCKSGGGDEPLRSGAFHFEAFVCASWQQDVSDQPPNLAAGVGTLCEDIWLHRYFCIAGLCWERETSRHCLWLSGPQKVSVQGCSGYLSLCKPDKHHRHKKTYKILVNKGSWEGDRLSSFSLLLSLCTQANLAVSQDLQL